MPERLKEIPASDMDCNYCNHYGDETCAFVRHKRNIMSSGVRKAINGFSKNDFAKEYPGCPNVPVSVDSLGSEDLSF